MAVENDKNSDRLTTRRPLGFSSFLTALVLLSSLPFVLLAVGVSVWTALDQRAGLLDEMAWTSRTLQFTVDRELELTETMLHTLASSRAFTQAVAAGPDGPPDRLAPFHEQALGVVRQRNGAIYNVVLHDAATGRQILNTLEPMGRPLPGVEAARAPEVRPADDPGAKPEQVFREIIEQRRPFVTDVFFGPVAQRYLAGVLLPVEQGGEVVAVLSAYFLPEHLGAVMRTQMPPHGHVASVVDRAGVILARSSDADRYVGQLATEPVRGFLADPRRAATERSVTADGAEVYGAYRKLEAAPWMIAYGAPRTVVDAPIRRLMLVMGGIGSLALGLFVATAIWQGRRLAREMEGLARDAELIGRGEAPPDRLERVREVGEVRAAMRAGVASLAAAEERMRLAIEGSGLATWELDPVADTILWSRHFPEMLGLPAGDAAPLPRSALIDRIHPDDAAALGAAWRAAEEEGGRFEAVFRIRRADDGSVRWLEAYGAWISSGPRRRFIGVTFDVTERHAADAQRRALMREVDHRAKNALAVVHSVVRLTRAKDGPSYAAAVEGRVRALARAHDLLARNHWEGVSLAALVADELAPRVASGQVALGGGDIRLPPEAVQPLSMVLHELATNAAAHGALSTAKGRVSLTWRVDPASGAVTLVWGERGGSPIAAPPVAGFGTRLIATTVEAQLGGSVAFDWAPEGLVCTLVLPAARLLVTKVPAAAPAGPAAPAGAGALAGKRVLVVEDEALIAAELALTLQDAGCATVGPAGTLAEGERLAGRPRTLDAAILDANLGGESSLPLARRLVAARVPVLVVTGYSELPAEWAAERGLAAVLRKPAEPGYLLEALRRAIEERLRAA